MRPNMYDASRSIAVTSGGDVPGESECFADDVVVDFPSVAPAVERIRLGLLADEHGAAMPAAVQISAHEARHGARVPLHVPLRATCTECGGRGESWNERCSRCRGTGTELRRHQLQVSVPAGVVNGSRFRFTVSPKHNPPTRIELYVRIA